MFSPLTSFVFLEKSKTILNTHRQGDSQGCGRPFRSIFGVTPEICAILWNMMRHVMDTDSKPKHFLWALIFLKGYSSEHVNAALTKTDEKTFRKWAWKFIEHIAKLNLIKWIKRLEPREHSVYKVSVDRTDVPIYERKPFNGKWFSHKFRGPGLRYEVGVSIETGNIVWINGPYPCGAYPDLKIFRLRMKQCLLPGEKVVADGGYLDERCSSSSTLTELKYCLM